MKKTKIKEKIKEYALENLATIVAYMVAVLKNKFSWNSINSNLSIVLVILSVCISSKRVKIKEFENLIYSTIYVINLVPSGYGKDKIVDDINKYFLKSFFDWFKKQTDEYRNKKINDIVETADKEFEGEINKLAKIKKCTETEKRKIRNIEYEISNATPEGFYTDAKTLQ